MFAKTGKPFEISLAKVTLQYLYITYQIWYVAFNYYKIHYICATTLRFTTHWHWAQVCEREFSGFASTKDISVTVTSAFNRSRPCSSSMLPILSVSWSKPWWKLLWWEIAHNWLQRFSEFANWTNTSGFPPRGPDHPGSSTSYHRRARSCWSYRPVLGLLLLLRRRPSPRSWSSDGDVFKLFW